MGCSVSRAHKTWSRWFLLKDFPFCPLLKRGGEKEAVPESRQSFEVAAARTSGLVNLVCSRRTGILCAGIRLLRNRCTKRTDIRPKFKAVS